ncbi:MAG: RNA-binding S4 domain-containing protein [Pararhodobacter sp.]
MSPSEGLPPDGGPIRLDKWLWHARFFKSRSLAAAACSGPMRLNGQPVAKLSALVRAGDVLTFMQERDVRVVRVLAPGTRRGPAEEARRLYDDLSPERITTDPSGASVPRSEAGGRPTGKARRTFDAFRDEGRDES